MTWREAVKEIGVGLLAIVLALAFLIVVGLAAFNL